MKKIKMVLYGEPGVGKSVFALGSPKPYFITTDGNYEWLEEFGAKEEDHLQVSSWKEAKKAFSNNYDKYETVVVDLAEDLFKWCENEYCIRNNIEHVSDIGFGKAYDTTRNEYFIQISKLLALDKNIILITHGSSIEDKDRRGVNHTKYIPSTRLPDKLIRMIEGRVRYFLRCYLKAEESNGKIIKKRYLSVVPKENEFGICRGIDENTIPHDIELSFSKFAEVIGFDLKSNKKKEKVIAKEEKVINKEEKIEENVITKEEKIEENVITKEENVIIKEEKIEENVITKEEKIEEKPIEKVEEIKIDKVAALKAKLAALKSKKGE